MSRAMAQITQQVIPAFQKVCLLKRTRTTRNGRDKFRMHEYFVNRPAVRTIERGSILLKKKYLEDWVLL